MGLGLSWYQFLGPGSGLCLDTSKLRTMFLLTYPAYALSRTQAQTQCLNRSMPNSLLTQVLGQVYLTSVYWPIFRPESKSYGKSRPKIFLFKKCIVLCHFRVHKLVHKLFSIFGPTITFFLIPFFILVSTILIKPSSLHLSLHTFFTSCSLPPFV